MKNILILILLFITANVFGQTFKYKYRIKLPNSSSYYFYKLDSITNPIDSFNLKIKIVNEKNEPLEFISVSIFNNGDTLHPFTNEDGLISVKLVNDLTTLEILELTNSYFKAIIPYHNKEVVKDFTIVLGKSFSLVIPIIQSKRPLSPEEINEIILDIYNHKVYGTKFKSKLFKEKVFILNYEI